MTDLNRPIAELIGDACPNVELAFPAGSPEFPLATVSVIDNSSAVVLSGKERYSSVMIQVDIWDNSPTRERCEQTACAVSDRFIEAGFGRSLSADIKEDGLHRKSMTFNGIIDNRTLEVYERS